MEKTLAICIRLVEFSESSYVATLFTEEFGKITGLAKGARRPKSAFENALDLLAVSRVVFLRKSSDAMDLLTEARLERPFRPATRDLNCLYAAYYVVELLNAMTDERDPHRDLFRKALETLEELVPGSDIGWTILRFELSLLRELGQLPALAACVECGRPIRFQEKRRVAFGLLAGGVLCDDCRAGRRHVVSLSQPTLERLVGLSKPDDAYDEKCTANERGELRGLMNHYMSHVLGRRPRMYDYLVSLR